jgi:hypothetical protein
MALDFDKLSASTAKKQTDPRKIFTTLNRSARFRRPSDQQGEVLDAWLEKRQRIDNTLKMNTGAGKTLVGLLILQSSLNDGISPAVYVTPDNYLVDQVVRESKDLGIQTTTNVDDSDYLGGKAILVINIQKLINGKSVFGVGMQGVKIPIGALVVDDAHACLQTVWDQFSLKLKNGHDVYKELFKLFQDDLSFQSRMEFLSIEAEDPQAFLRVPFWSWQNKQKEVSAILHKHRSDEDLQFNFPLLSDVLPLCQCVIGGAELEISPRCLPIDVIPSFGRARRRIYMTATLADDGILITHFNANPDAVSDPIRPKGAGDIGDRLILAPQEITPAITKDEVKKLVADISRRKNVVVIVPSFRIADYWKDVAQLTLHRKNLVEGIKRLKKEHVGLSVLVNKYDGIDLPDEACRVLVIDGLPEVYGITERNEMLALEGTALELARQVQRIEQGMGRGVRSSEDYCVVLLLGAKLTKRVHLPGAREKFNPATLAQIDLGKAVSDQVRGKPLKELRPILDLCLKQDEKWLQASRNALVSAEEGAKSHVDPNAVLNRRHSTWRARRIIQLQSI